MDLTLRTYPDRILRNMCAPIFCVGEQVMLNPAELLDLANSMVSVLVPWKAAGLAAPQVGYPIRLMVVRLNEEGDALRICDPHVIQHGRNVNTAIEGCLSLPGQTFAIARWDSVKIRFLNVDGRKNTLSARGMLARVIQHEMDHLNGWLINSEHESRQAAAKINQEKQPLVLDLP